MRRRSVLSLILLLLYTLTLSFSCIDRNRDILERVDLFFMKPGKLFNELNYFYKDSQQLNGYSRIFMKDGLFYITDSGAGKVLELTSYGDVLGIIYNPANTPPPPETLNEQNGETNRKISTWVFQSIYAVGVTDDHILVGDTLPENRAVWNEEQQVYLSHVILRFNRKGEYTDYLGQEGIGTVPFPHVVNVNVRPDGEIIVTSRSEIKWSLFWFTSEGILRYRIEFQPENLPRYGEDREPSLIKIIPDPVTEDIHLQIDYIPVGPAAKEKGPESRFYNFSLKEKSYDKGIALPDNIMQFNKKQYSVPYLYLGTIKNGLHYFLSPQQANLYTLLIINDKSEIKAKRQIRIPDSDLMYNDLYLTPDGILTMIAYMNNGALVSWWRADKLVGVIGGPGEE
jgi:hypothetical protein